MNEFEKLINYLNSIINDIENKRKTIEQQNSKNAILKPIIEKIIEQINNQTLNQIDLNELENTLKEILTPEEVAELKTKLTDLITMQQYLFDERISNPIKQAMLEDLETIKNRLVQIKDSMVELQLSEQDIELQNKCKKYLTYINEKEFTKTLTVEERKEFYEFLKEKYSEGALEIIFNYITYANKNKRQFEINTSNTAIDITERNADEVISELSEALKEKKPITPKLPTKKKKQQTKQKVKIDFTKVQQKIMELLEFHKGINISPDIYEVHKKRFIEQKIIEIYNTRDQFLLADGINWEMAIPCIIEKLLPSIDTNEDQQVLYNLLNEIIISNQKDIERKQQEAAKRKVFEEKFQKTAQKFKETIQEFNDVIANVGDIISKLAANPEINDNVIDTLLDMSQKKDDETLGADNLFKHYKTTSLEVEIYKIYTEINEYVSYITEFLTLGTIDEKDLAEIENDTLLIIKGKLEELKTIIESDKFKSRVTTPPPTGPVEPPQPKEKQYESCNNVIVFYRKDDTSKFMIEDDIEESMTYGDARLELASKPKEILKRLNDMEFTKLNTNYPKFCQPIKNGPEKNAAVHYFVCQELDKKYCFYRASLREDVRISFLKIDLSEEQRIKFKFPTRQVLLIIGLQYITNHENQKKSTYSSLISQLEGEHSKVAEIIRCLETGENKEILYKLLNDSSTLYDRLIGKGKGLEEA